MIYAVNKRTKEHYEVPYYSYMQSCDWRYVDASPDGWIEWQGDNEKPLPDGSEEFEIRTRRGDEGKGILGRWTWGRNTQQQEYDIIAYRPIFDADTGPTIDVTRLVTSAEPPAWDGEGLPPVGCECIYLGNKERQGEITHHTRYAAVIEYPNGGYDVGGPACFRPIRSEEDRAIDTMVAIMEHEIEKDGAVANSTQIERGLDAVYAAIRDGKIPGVKLENT